MSLSDMKLYLALCLKGQTTIPKRKEILEKQRNALKKEMKRLQEDIALSLIHI